MNYRYTRTRRDLGGFCDFQIDESALILDIPSDKKLCEQYATKGFIDKEVQAVMEISMKEICSVPVKMTDHGVNHLEGGWPREINLQDEDQVTRYCKRALRDDAYVDVMKNLTAIMEQAVLQNNAINIYQNYEVANFRALEKPSLQVRNDYRSQQKSSPVTFISWLTGNQASLLAVTMNSTKSFIWDLANPNEPAQELTAFEPMTYLQFINKESTRLICGLRGGQIALWSQKNISDVDVYSDPIFSHRDTVTSLLWIASKTGTTFFTSSLDGTIKWWDCTDITKPTDAITIGKPLTVLEYDPGQPTRFLVGTADGFVIAGNRKGINDQEKLPWRIKSSSGPIASIQRNFAFSKNFLVLSESSVRIWSENCREAPILRTPPCACSILDAQWSHSRPSIFIAVREDGVLDLWDIIQQLKSPIISLKLSDSSLTTVNFQESGDLLAVGCANGSTFLLQLSSSLNQISVDEKVVLGELFDRELDREKMNQNKVKEVKMKNKKKEVGESSNKEGIDTSSAITKDLSLSEVEKMYLSQIDSS